MSIVTGAGNTTTESLAEGKTDRLWKPWKLSDDAIDFLKDFEKFKSAIYNDSEGHATIGYGHLIHRGSICGAISEQPFLNAFTKEQATVLLRNDLKSREEVVNTSVRVPLFQNEYDALVIFCFNIGNAGFNSSTVLKKINAGKYDQVPDKIMIWNKAKGKEVNGLTNRRLEEVEIYRDAEYGRQR